MRMEGGGHTPNPYPPVRTYGSGRGEAKLTSDATAPSLVVGGAPKWHDTQLVENIRLPSEPHCSPV